MYALRMPTETLPYGGPIISRCGLMRFALLPPSGMIDAERFIMLPTHRTNFKKGP